MKTLSTYLLLLVVAAAGIFFQLEWLTLTGLVLIISLAVLQGVVKSEAVKIEEQVEEMLPEQVKNDFASIPKRYLPRAYVQEDYGQERTHDEAKWAVIEETRKERMKGLSEEDKKYFISRSLNEEQRATGLTKDQLLEEKRELDALRAQLQVEEQIGRAVDSSLSENETIEAMPREIRDAVKELIKDEALAEFRKEEDKKKKK